MEKLQPKQLKLWRKTYHQERDQGAAPAVAAQKADDAVKAWEERGAFDEESAHWTKDLESNLQLLDDALTKPVDDKHVGVDVSAIIKGMQRFIDKTRPWMLIASHQHARMSVIKSPPGDYSLVPGDELQFGLCGRALVIGVHGVSEDAIVFDVVAEGQYLRSGDTAHFVSPRPGIAAEAKAL